MTISTAELETALRNSGTHTQAYRALLSRDTRQLNSTAEPHPPNLTSTSTCCRYQSIGVRQFRQMLETSEWST